MRKIYYLLFPFLLLKFSQEVQAQPVKSLWLDVKAGLNTSFIINQNAYGNGELEYSTTFGITGGPGASYFLSEIWGLNTSLNWAKLGQNYSGMQSGGDSKRKVKLNYLELPLQLMRKINGPTYPTWVALGPELMFLTSATQDYQRDDGGTLPNGEYMIEGITDIKERYKPIDLALNFSISKIYDIYQNDKLRLIVSANIAIGLTDINHKDWHIPNLHGEYAGSHNFFLGLNVGFMYKAFVNED